MSAEEDRKQRIRSMIDAFVDDDNEQVEMDFHHIVTSKVRNLMGIEDMADDEDEVELEDEAETVEDDD